MIIRPFISRPSSFSTWLQQKHRSRFLRRTVLHFCLALFFLNAFILLKTSGPGSVLLNVHAAPFSGTPYTGTAITLPGRIEVENFDNGGEGVAYHDTTATNDGGAYRAEGVDVCTCGSPYGWRSTFGPCSFRVWFALKKTSRGPQKHKGLDSTKYLHLGRPWFVYK